MSYSEIPNNSGHPPPSHQKPFPATLEMGVSMEMEMEMLAKSIAWHFHFRHFQANWKRVTN